MFIIENLSKENRVNKMVVINAIYLISFFLIHIRVNFLKNISVRMTVKIVKRYKIIMFYYDGL